MTLPGRWIKWVEKDHLCHLPRANEYPEPGIGSRWECCCGTIWEYRGVEAKVETWLAINKKPHWTLEVAQP